MPAVGIKSPQCFYEPNAVANVPVGSEAMARYLSARGIRLFDYPRWAEPLREALRTHAERLAAEASLEIEFIRHYKAFRKEERVKAILATRGEQPGLVHIFSAMEACPSYRPWHDKLVITGWPND